MIFRVSEDKSNLVVAEEFAYKWKYNSVTHRITVPEGFEFKLGAKIRLGSLGLIDLFAPTYSLTKVTAVHDYLYHLNELGEINNMPREIADEVMRSDDSDPKWLREIAWLICRIVGYFLW